MAGDALDSLEGGKDPARARMRASWIDIGLFALVYVALCAGALNPTIHGRDGLGNYAPLRSMLFDGDLDFANDFALFDNATDGRFRFREIPIVEATGRPANRYGVGAAILWAPFVAPVWATAPIGMDGLESAFVWAVGIGSAFWTGMGLVVVYWTCRRRFGRGAGWIGAGAALILSPLPVYAFFHTGMSHAGSFFAMSALLAAWIAGLERQRVIWRLAIGIAAGLAVMTRSQNAAPVIAVFALDAALAGFEARRLGRRATTKRLAGIAISILVAGIVFLPQMMAWHAIYGSWFSGPAPYLEYESFNPLIPRHILPVLVSTNHGLLFWHPALCLGLIGLIAMARRRLHDALGLAAAFLGLLLIVSAWPVWWGGASFGARFFQAVLIVFGMGWAAMFGLSTSRWARVGIVLLLALGAAWNAGLAVQYGTQMIPREGAVAPTRIVENQFTQVPSLLWEKAAQAVLRKPELVEE